MNAAWAVFRKEWVDALRDRRTLLVALLSSVAIGPLVLWLVGSLIGDLERRADQRVVLMQGAEHAPTLVNFIQRQTFKIEAPPADHEVRLRAGKLANAVVVVAPDFEARLAEGNLPQITVLGNSSRPASANAIRRNQGLLQGFAQELASHRLAMLGVVSAELNVVEVQERDLANRQARLAQLTGMVPFFVLMAVLYGSMAAAMDTTAGERERGSLEPLLTNPPSRGALVVGKWAAVAAVGMLIALLACLSFLPAQSLMRSETLAAMFQFGLREALWFLALLLPFAAAAAALMMAVAIRARSFKEAQANNTAVMLVFTLMPMITLFGQEGEQPWHIWVPGLGQVTLMNRVLKGEVVGWEAVAIVCFVCVAIVVLGLTYLTRSIQRASIR